MLRPVADAVRRVQAREPGDRNWYDWAALDYLRGCIAGEEPDAAV